MLIDSISKYNERDREKREKDQQSIQSKLNWLTRDREPLHDLVAMLLKIGPKRVLEHLIDYSNFSNLSWSLTTNWLAFHLISQRLKEDCIITTWLSTHLTEVKNVHESNKPLSYKNIVEIVIQVGLNNHKSWTMQESNI